MAGKSKLTPIEKAELVHRYNDHKVRKEFLAIRYNISVRTVERILKEDRDQLRKK